MQLDKITANIIRGVCKLIVGHPTLSFEQKLSKLEEIKSLFYKKEKKDA
jgi:hypothetical protein